MKYLKVTFSCLMLALILSLTFATEGSETKVKVVEDDHTEKPTITPTTNATTTAAPNTTTTSPVPTTAPTTTAKPTSTSEKPTPTTPAPPHPVPEDGVWIVNSTTTNETCIMLKTKIDVHAEYKNGNVTNSTEFTVPNKVGVKGSCDNNSQFIELTWNQIPVNSSSIKFVFNKDNSSQYFVENVYILTFVNVTKNGTLVPEPLALNYTGKAFLAHVNNSYTCAEPTPLDLKGNATGHLTLNSLQYEAYGHSKDRKFSSAEDCASSETPDIVPILVAGALILLVILVLVAYVITNKRSQARGYLSM